VDDVAFGQLELVGFGLGELDVRLAATGERELDAHLEPEMYDARDLSLL
jgi:hypothetical protein